MRFVKILAFFSLVLLISFGFRQKAEEVSVTAKLVGCDEKLNLYQFDGVAFKPVDVIVGKEGVYDFTVPKGAPEFYYIGKETSNILPIILGPEENVVIDGSCRDLRSSNVDGSPFNKRYREIREEVGQFGKRTGALIQEYRLRKDDPEQLQQVVDRMKALDQEKLTYLEEAKKEHPFFGRVVALNTYLSFQNNNEEGTYRDEMDYFAKTFFQFADFTDAGYNGLPWVYESFKSYVTTLASVGMPVEMERGYVQAALDEIPSGSKAHKMALSGAIGIFKRRNSPNFIHFGKQFVEAFQEKDPFAAKSLADELKNAESFMIGGQAPDFTQQTPEGKDLSLSDFKGKVLLVDFWASWCGPCRRENPNVVRMYEEYKAQGFEILGVSLDKTKDRWLKAIEQDGLTWAHVSDLKGWQNEVAQMYGVSSIPHTILLDAEGKIIARNLRGRALEMKLKEIFDK